MSVIGHVGLGVDEKSECGGRIVDFVDPGTDDVHGLDLDSNVAPDVVRRCGINKNGPRMNREIREIFHSDDRF